MIIDDNNVEVPLHSWRGFFLLVWSRESGVRRPLTGAELLATGSYAGTFKDAKLADKIVRMNYDIHVGAVLGIPGKLLAFFGSLIAASLPVTGFIIWWGRRKKTKATAKPETQKRFTVAELS